MSVLDVSRAARRRMRIAASLPDDPPPQMTAVGAAIDTLPDPEDLCAEERAAAMAACARERNRLDAYLCRLAGIADRHGDSRLLGAGTTGTLIAAATTSDPATGSAIVARARALRTLPATEDAYQAGAISTAHVAAIVANAHRIDDFADLEPDVVTIATCTEPRETRRILDVLVAQSRPDSPDSDYDRGRAKRGLSLSQLPAGTWGLDGHLDRITGQQLAEALRLFDRRTGPEDTRSATQRRADAFADLISAALASTAPLGVSSVSILVDADALTSGRLDDDTLLGARLTELITCDPLLSIIHGHKTPDGGFIPLRLDRLVRCATPAQRQALAARDRGCIRCGKPPRYCQAHHIIGWACGGSSDLENLCLLCARCHHDLHFGHFTIHTTDVGIPVITPSRAPPCR